MEVTIFRTEIVNDIGAIYLMSTKSSDPFPPRGKMDLSIEEAIAEMDDILSSYIRSAVDGEDKTTRKYDLNFTTRKAASKDLSMKMVMQSYVVNSALARIYSDMALADLSGMHAAKQNQDLNMLKLLIYKKREPEYED